MDKIEQMLESPFFYQDIIYDLPTTNIRKEQEYLLKTNTLDITQGQFDKCFVYEIS
jgi:hypothetical protein